MLIHYDHAHNILVVTIHPLALHSHAVGGGIFNEVHARIGQIAAQYTYDCVEYTETVSHAHLQKKCLYGIGVHTFTKSNEVVTCYMDPS